MPYLYCQKHGQEAIKSLLNRPDPNEESSEYTKVICGLLLKDFYCDKCNQKLSPNSLAYLFQYFPNSTYESPQDFAEYFNDPIWLAYKPEKEYSLEENMYFEHIPMSSIKNILPEDIHNLFKSIWTVRPV